MSAPIDFYFDFSSPYGYLASEKIEPLASMHGRSVDWHPILLGIVVRPSAPGAGKIFLMPSTFPIATQAPARIVLWLKGRDPVLATTVAHALYRGFFRDDIDISNPDAASTIAAGCGADAAAARASIDDPAMKDALRSENAQAIAAGVFGSPFIVVDGEPFWGVDHLDQVDRWLATGGW